MVKYTLEGIEQKKKSGESWKDIGGDYGMKAESIRRAYYRLLKKQERKKNIRDKSVTSVKVKPLQKISQSSMESEMEHRLKVLEQQLKEMEAKMPPTQDDIKEYMELIKKPENGVADYLAASGKIDSYELSPILSVHILKQLLDKYSEHHYHDYLEKEFIGIDGKRGKLSSDLDKLCVFLQHVRDQESKSLL